MGQKKRTQGPPTRDDWSHPRDRLPLNRGPHPYTLPKRERKPPASGDPKGWLAGDGSVWQYFAGSGSKICEHWDVQYDGGDYSNVTPDGEIHHGE